LTRVVVSVVDTGGPTVFHLFSDSQQGRASAEPGEGNLKVGSVHEANR
jgi:hypothetical protein